MTRPGEGLLGAVLAGGRSRRFGSPKAGAEVAGTTLLDRAVRALDGEVSETVLILSSDPSRDPEALPDLPVRRDAAADLGPLEGLRVALEWAREDGRVGVLALACDLPLVDRRVVGALVAAWRDRPPDRRDGVVPRVDGVPQPLAAVYAVEVLDPVRRRLAGGDRSLRGLLADLRVRYLDTDAPPLAADRFLNVNTPADRDRASARIRATGSPVGRGVGDAP